MRFVLILLGLIVVVVGVLIATGMIRVWQTRDAVVQAPAFNAALPSLSVGMENKVVSVPTMSVQKPGNTTAPAQ